MCRELLVNGTKILYCVTYIRREFKPKEKKKKKKKTIRARLVRYNRSCNVITIT